MKTVLRNNWASFLIAVLVLGYGIFSYPNLPDRMVSHFNLQGNPDGFSSKAFLILFIPLLTCLLLWLIPTLLQASPAEFRMKNSQTTVARMNFIFALFLGGIQLGILVTNLYPGRYRFASFISLAFAAFMMGLGNLLKNTERNFFIGIKTPWTVTSDRNWTATHIFAGRVMLALGFVLMLSSFFSDRLYVAMGVIFFSAVLPITYSFWFYRTREERGADREKARHEEKSKRHHS